MASNFKSRPPRVRPDKPKADTDKPTRNRRKKGDPPRSKFEALRDELGWSSRYVAQQVGGTSAIVDRWALNDTAPLAIMTWMEGCVAFHRSYKPPKGWQTRPGKSRK